LLTSLHNRLFVTAGVFNSTMKISMCSMKKLSYLVQN
jgi:hypothetical protein